MNEHIDDASGGDPFRGKGGDEGESHDDHGPREGDQARRERIERKRREEGEPTNFAEQGVSPTLRGRESKCNSNCGSDGGCGSGGACSSGVDTSPLVELIVNQFDYADARRIVELTHRGSRREFAVIEDEGMHVRVHDKVVIEGERGVELATVTMTGSLVHAKRKAKRISNEPLSTVVRVATPRDLERVAGDHQAEREALSVCRSRVEAFRLPMHLVEAEWQFDHRRITFYFTADGRVDFRELVRDLAAIFHARIELRQIAVRDEAKRMGGMGICGKELCCSTHLGRYEHITLDHAKAQQLQINPTKLSGLCGRLKCCLLYELDNYVEGLKRFPPLESTIFTTKGEGLIQKIDIFRDVLYLYHHDIHQFETLTLDELQSLLPRQEELRRAGTQAAQTRRRPGGEERAK